MLLTHRVLLTATTLTLLATAPALASHDTAARAVCNALGTSEHRPGVVTCNDRQDCLNKIPRYLQGHARTTAEQTCNALSASRSCPGTVSFNPREECLAKLPPAPTLHITSIAVGDGPDMTPSGTFQTVEGQDTFFTIKGPNVNLPDNTVVSDGTSLSHLSLSHSSASCNRLGLPQLNCVVVWVKALHNVQPATAIQPTGHVSLRTAHGQSQSFAFVVLSAVVGAPARPGGPVIGSGGHSSATTSNPPATTVTLQFDGCTPYGISQGGTASCALYATITGNALATPGVTGVVKETSQQVVGGGYLSSISPNTFTVPAGQLGARIFLANVTLSTVVFSDPNQFPGRPAPGSSPYSSLATIQATVSYPMYATNPTAVRPIDAEQSVSVPVYAKP
jgi:hypothetical protein